MTKTDWTILGITALTDCLLAFASGLLVGNAASGASYPSGPTILYAGVGGLVLGLRTVQQGLKALRSAAPPEAPAPGR